MGAALAAACGLGGAVQARVNGELGVRLNDGIAAAALSFGVGLVVVTTLVLALPSGRRGALAVRSAVRAGELPAFQLLGGVCGAAFVASQGISAAPLGIAVFTVAAVAGQSVSSLAVDRLGLGPARPEPVTAARLVGAVLAVVAVAVAVADDLRAGPTLALAALPAVSGVLIAWQQAVNGRVRQAAGGGLAGGTVTATFVNFAAGMAALLLALAVDLAVRGPTRPLPDEPLLYIGGVLGVVFIAVAAAVVRHTGVLLLGLATIAGQVVGALLIDLVAPAQGGRPETHTYVGAALTLLAVAIAAAPHRSRTSPPIKG